VLVILGANGQVGRELCDEAALRKIPVQAYNSQSADFRDPCSVIEHLHHLPAGSWVVNAAAYTNVDAAESNAAVARQINAVTPGLIAQTCSRQGLRLLHISTDYVFAGDKAGRYTEQDAVGPLGVYGQSKLEGEQLIQGALAETLILRTAWVFSPHNKNFVKTMRRIGAERNEISVVKDQTGGPTSATSIARTCLNIIDQIQQNSHFTDWGVYHYCGTPTTSWDEFAKEIFRQSQMNVSVRSITTSEYPTPARRPANSTLDCSRLQRVFGISQPDWRTDLSDVLSRLIATP